MCFEHSRSKNQEQQRNIEQVAVLVFALAHPLVTVNERGFINQMSNKMLQRNGGSIGVP
jgi:hypothetical protein